jgi:hypothetical protein
MQAETIAAAGDSVGKSENFFAVEAENEAAKR